MANGSTMALAHGWCNAVFEDVSCGLVPPSAPGWLPMLETTTPCPLQQYIPAGLVSTASDAKWREWQARTATTSPSLIVKCDDDMPRQRATPSF